MIINVISDKKSSHLIKKKPLIFYSWKEKWIVPKICTPTKLSSCILKLSSSVMNISNNLQQTVTYMNKLLRVLFLKVFGIKPLN